MSTMFDCKNKKEASYKNSSSNRGLFQKGNASFISIISIDEENVKKILYDINKITDIKDAVVASVPPKGGMGSAEQ